MYKKALEKYLLFLAVMVQMHYLCKLYEAARAGVCMAYAAPARSVRF